MDKILDDEDKEISNFMKNKFIKEFSRNKN